MIVRLLLATALAALLSACTPADDDITVSREEAARIGERIFANECAGRIACLTSWNAGEEFPSLGIGHFIWYPQGKSGPFRESFPELIRYMEAGGARIPAWLNSTIESGAPWPSREAFLAAQDSPPVIELRTLLARSKELQTGFMIRRLNRALPAMLAATPATERAAIREQFRRVAAAPMGYYALIDYVNFKGEGTKASERYRDHGWGLLQVLQEMNRAGHDDALESFSAAAVRVLARRVANSPTERNEKRWLPGWEKRVAGYRNAVN